MATFNFNDYVGNYDYTINPEGYTFLNAPATITNVFRFSASTAFQSASLIQIIDIAGSNVLYVREYIDSAFQEWKSITATGGNFQGYWQASTNSPTLANGTGTIGYYYTNTSSGTNSVDFGAGAIAFNQNDSVAYGQDGNWYNAGQQGSIQVIRTDTPNQLYINPVDGTVTINAQTGTTENKLVIVGEGNVIDQSILPVVSVAKGGTNSSTALANSKIMGSVAGAIVEISSIPSGVSANSAQVLNPTNQAQETLQKTLQDVLDASGGTGTFTINPTQIKGNNNVASSVYINPTLPSNPYQGVPCSNISNAGSFNYITDTNIDNVTGSSVVNATIKIMCFAGTDLIAPQSIDIALSLTALADDFADYLPINTNVNTLNLSPNENKFYTATITGTSPSSTGIFALNFAFSGIQGTGQILLIGSANLNIVIS